MSLATDKKALKAWRARHGYTVEECARLCEMSVKSWQRYESMRPELNHGAMKVFPVPFWLRLFVKRNKPLPEGEK